MLPPLAIVLLASTVTGKVLPGLAPVFFGISADCGAVSDTLDNNLKIPNTYFL